VRRWEGERVRRWEGERVRRWEGERVRMCECGNVVHCYHNATATRLPYCHHYAAFVVRTIHILQKKPDHFRQNFSAQNDARTGLEKNLVTRQGREGQAKSY
jgi:hypothetical protein